MVGNKTDICSVPRAQLPRDNNSSEENKSGGNPTDPTDGSKDTRSKHSSEGMNETGQQFGRRANQMYQSSCTDPDPDSTLDGKMLDKLQLSPTFQHEGSEQKLNPQKPVKYDLSKDIEGLLNSYNDMFFKPKLSKIETPHAEKNVLNPF